MNNLMNPCYEYCFLRHGRQYSTECDTFCQFAAYVAENRHLKSELEKYRNSKDASYTDCKLDEI